MQHFCCQNPLEKGEKGVESIKGEVSETPQETSQFYYTEPGDIIGELICGIDPGILTGFALVDVSPTRQRLLGYGWLHWKHDPTGLLELSKCNTWGEWPPSKVIILGLPGGVMRVKGRDPRPLTKCAVVGGLSARILSYETLYVVDEIAALRAVATFRRRGKTSPSNQEVWFTFWAYFPEARAMEVKEIPRYEHIRDAALLSLYWRIIQWAKP